jgi:RNA-binding protein
MLGCLVMTPLILSGKQRRHLRALGHHLDPGVHMGKEGLSEGLLSALDAVLERHELVKVRLGEAAGEDRTAIAEALAEGAHALLVGVLGRVVLLYRRHPTEPKIQLPKATKG